MEERIYTSVQIDALKRDIEEKCKSSNVKYPICISSDDGKGEAVASILPNLEKVGDAKKFEYDTPGLVFKGAIQKYKFIVPSTGETGYIELPVDEGMDVKALYTMGASIIEYAEAYRKLINMTTSIHASVVRTGMLNSGVVLADMIAGVPGISTVVEKVIKATLDKSLPVSVVNEYLKRHESVRVVTEMKDKYMAANNKQYAEACRLIAKKISDAPAIKGAAFESNGINPSVVHEAPMSVLETTSIKPINNNQAKYMSILGLSNEQN